MKTLFSVLFAGTIIWSRPDGGVSVTSVFVGTATDEALRLKANGAIPADWEAVAFDAALPGNRDRRDQWRWDRQQGRLRDDLPLGGPKPR